MHRPWIFALCLAAALGISAPSSRCNPPSQQPVSGESFEADRATAAKELVTGLEKYAEWCSSKKIWVERNRALELILTIDPGNMSAKRGLGWLQVADGVWEPPKDPKPAKNYDPSALKEAPAHFAEAIKAWREHMIGLLEAHKNQISSSQRDSVCQQLLAIDPNDPFVRASRDEENNGKSWVLAETVRAKARRTEIKAIVKQALADASAVKDFVPTTNDMVYTIDWKSSVSTDRVRVLSTGERAEAVRVAQVLHASRDVFQKVFGTATEFGGNFTIYLLCDKDSKKQYLDNMPGLSASQRSFYDQVDGSGLQGSNSGCWWSPSPERRLDGVTRHAIGTLFQSEFNLTVDTAWAWEGLGLYLTRELIGTRYTWYIVPAQENQSVSAKRVGPDWMKKLLTPGTNWMNEGWRLLKAGGTMELTATLNRPLNKMTPQDLFLSYVVAAYLLETQPARLSGMLRGLAGGKAGGPQKAMKVFPAALAMDLDQFATRLERWLGERR